MSLIVHQNRQFEEYLEPREREVLPAQLSLASVPCLHTVQSNLINTLDDRILFTDQKVGK